MLILASLQSYARDVVADAYDKIAWRNTDDWIQKLETVLDFSTFVQLLENSIIKKLCLSTLSSSITELACKAGYEKCLLDASQRFQNFTERCAHSLVGTGRCNL